MRCPPKFCIGLLVVGIGGIALLAYTGNAKAVYALSFLPFLACPLMCMLPMMFGKSCHGDECNRKKAVDATSQPPHAQE